MALKMGITGKKVSTSKGSKTKSASKAKSAPKSLCGKAGAGLKKRNSLGGYVLANCRHHPEQGNKLSFYDRETRADIKKAFGLAGVKRKFK